MNAIIDKLKHYPLAVICAVVLILFAGLAFLRGGLVAELSTQEADLVSRLRVVSTNVKNAKSLEEDVAALEDYLSAIDEHLFRWNERSINTNFFYAFEDDLDIIVSDVKQLTVEDPALSKGGPHELKLHSAITYDVSVGGTFEQILRFLYEIHQVGPLMRVADFQVESSTARIAVAGALSAEIRVVVLAEVNK